MEAVQKLALCAPSFGLVSINNKLNVGFADSRFMNLALLGVRP